MENVALSHSSSGGTTLAKVGERLIQLKHITRDQLQIALHEQRRTGMMLGDALLKLGFIDEETLASVLAIRTGLDNINLKNHDFDPALLTALPQGVAQRCRAVPLSLSPTTLEIAMADPYDVVAMDEIRRYFPRGIDVMPRVASGADITEVLDRYSALTLSLDHILREIEEGKTTAANTKDDWQHPVIRLVNVIIHDAVRLQASDIHMEPEEHFIRVRYRVDGVLHQARALHRDHWPEISHRLKIMAGMNIADTRNIQDGRFSLKVGSAEIDFRMAVMPIVHGENIVIRVLDHRRAQLSLADLGYSPHTLRTLTRLLDRPEGMVLVTGPTGSGKTTTLYSMLRQVSDTSINVMTLEEPVEYRFPLIRQTAVQDKHGMGFADGVRGIMRQDPDIILVGEIRDHETAHMALRAAMTGHKLFSTLHCNEALAAVPRLIDLNLSPRMLLGNIAGVVAQRLVRRLCPHCRTTRPATYEESTVLADFDVYQSVESSDVKIITSGFAENQMLIEETPTIGLRIGVAEGCAKCHGTGYLGRLAVAEVMSMTSEIDDLFVENAPRGVLADCLRRDGFASMARDAFAKIAAGLTTFEEVRRCVPYVDSVSRGGN